MSVTKINVPMQKMKDSLAKQLFGKTVEEARATGMCIDCGEDAIANCYSKAGIEEYRISGLCEKCFDEITGG